MNKWADLLINAYSEKYLPKIEINSIDCVITDPPYGLQFMSKDWDKTLPSKQTLSECLRVLKPGAFGLWMCSPRQDLLSRMIMLLDDVGFNVNFTSLYWTYATGFPKASNIGRGIDKKFGLERKTIGKNPNSRPSHKGKDSKLPGGWEHYPYNDISIPNSPQAKEMNNAYGGYQPKPAVEVIIITMKPLLEENYVNQALENKKGITWLNNVRIPLNNKIDDKRLVNGSGIKSHKKTHFGKAKRKESIGSQNITGRFPANLLVSDNILDDGKVRTSGKLSSKNYPNGIENPWVSSKRFMNGDLQYGGDSGSYSRYFNLDKWFTQQIPFFIVSKPTKKEKDIGVEHLRQEKIIKKKMVIEKGNFHPTVKPITLKTYLIALCSQPNDVILDPYLGSGTTLIASKLMKRRCIGIEKSKKYFEIAKERVKNESVNHLVRYLKESLPIQSRKEELNKWI